MSLNEPVPQPPLKPIVGNLTELQGGCPIQNLMGQYHMLLMWF